MSSGSQAAVPFVSEKGLNGALRRPNPAGYTPPSPNSFNTRSDRSGSLLIRTPVAS